MAGPRPSPAEVARYVRSRLPFGAPVQADDSSLPFVGRRPSVKPILPVRDMAEATAFYEALGFSIDSYDGGYAWVKHCGWEWFHLRLVEGLDPESNATSAYLHVDDARAWRAGMLTASAGAGLDGLGEVTDMPWGMREFAITDPSGNVVRVGQNL